jgi:hypothetical protein
MGQQVYQVPWKFFHPNQAVPSEGLTLYWFPASAVEVQQSSLRTSRDLSLYAAGCIAMYVADGTAPVVKKLAANSTAPLAVLVDASGNVIGQVGAHKGRLRVEDVENLVEDELSRRDDLLAARLAEGRAKAKAGDKPGATRVFQSVWAERCLFPKRAKEAARELKKLGVTIADAKSDTSDASQPVFAGPVAAQVVSIM